MTDLPNMLTGRRALLQSCISGGVFAALGAPMALCAAPAPGVAGFSPTRLKRIDEAMAAMVDRRKTPGMVGLIYRRGEVAHVTLAGWQDIAAKTPIRRDTIFQIMSMTKPITATAVLILVDEGRIGLYDPIEKYLPELADRRVLRAPGAALDDTVPAARPIRIVDLLDYTSGLPSTLTPPADSPLAKASAGLYADPMPNPAAWLAALAALPLSHQPGEAWAYGTGSDVLGILVSRVSGQPYGDFLRDRIFVPLGMKDTAYHVPPAKRPRLAELYSPDPSTGGFKLADRAPFPDAPPPFPLGASGLASTADDYLRFARMLLGKGKVDDVRILSRRAFTLMTSNHLTEEQRAAIPSVVNPLFRGQGWGLGIAMVVDPARQDENVGFASLGTFGWPGAFGTWWQADPQEDMIQIYMEQCFSGDANVLPRRVFEQMAYEAIED